MERMTKFERLIENRNALKEAESQGRVADSKEVRMALMNRVHKGEITLEQAQSELKKIKRKAKSNGQITRNQAYTGRY